MKKNTGIAIIFGIFIILFFSLTSGFISGYAGAFLFNRVNTQRAETDVQVVKEESAVIDVASTATDSVVSVVISKDLPVFEDLDLFDFWNFSPRKQIGTEQQQVGAGTGFIATEDGLIITNRHVVEDADASYTVVFNNGDKYEATILAMDTLLDIAFLKIDAKNLTPLKLGTSSEIQVGQTVIAIGNALGEFSNTVSSGIISGIGRSITASDSTGASSELLTNVFQTDASINKGNSGGPLLDINGNVIGVNVAVAVSAENIGFAIPIDDVKDLMGRLNADGTIDRPRLGVRIAMIDKQFMEENELSVDYGALVISGNSKQLAVLPNSPADKAGILAGDIILEIDGKKLTTQNPLPNVIQSYKIGDTITLKILREEENLELQATLDKF